MRPMSVAAALLFASSFFALSRAEDASQAAGGIQWFASWEQGAAEAKRTGRPILLVAAAPHCHEVSGLW
jgi:hypothetical protein